MGLLEIGRIIRCHGLAGRVKVLSYLESQDVLDNLPQVHIGRKVRETVPFSVDAVQPGREFFILKLGGIEDRDSAAKLVRSSVWMSSDKMEKLPEGEFYWRDIIGLRVVTEEGQILGRIESVFPTGGNDVYVCRGGKAEILLPAIEDVVRKIDTEQGIMVIRLLKGLVES
jgi:16S rRNA processing protein RimM